MIKALYDRIATMDLKRPYVWRLAISSAEFAALEAAVQAGTTNALQNVVYLAEWYKRRYDGGQSKPVREFVARELFEESGIDQGANLFETESGKSWLYSIYILGGVAIPFELGKRNTRFLKELCKIYYGEEGDVDKLDVKDKARALAFRESVRNRGSLYEYIKAVLSGDKPFAAEDLADKGSQVNAFIDRVKSANDEILRSKFDLEWIIGFDADAEYMTRKLRLVLRPESLGGLNHQYLKFERVVLWGIKKPEVIKRIEIGIRFLNGADVVAEPDFANPIIEYAATGQQETGFIAWYTERFSRKIDVPVKEFDGVEIIARDDAGTEHLVERFDVQPWMQVFRVPDGYNEWTSRHVAQRESALVCSSGCEIADDDTAAPSVIYRKRFWRKGGEESPVFQWRQVIDKVEFLDEKGGAHALYNRQGYDQIVAWPHRELLHLTNGLVSYTEEFEGELEESYLPLIFGRPDLIVRHFETKSDLMDEPEGDNADYERIEFRDGIGYREWTDVDKPPQGKITLRVTIRGVARKFVAYHLPITLVRDCQNHRILFGDDIIEDVLVKNGIPTDPVVHKSLGSDSAFVSLEIWRPTRHKEIIRDGNVIKYVAEGETAEISYLLKDGLVIHDFSESGYCEYECKEMGTIYRLPAFNPNDDSQLKAYENGLSTGARALDARAPSWLKINLACPFKRTAKEKLLYWNYLSVNPPLDTEDDSLCQGDDLVFHSLKGYEGLCVLSCKITEPNPFSDVGDELRSNLVGCFEVATECQSYYFIMQPFREANMDLKTDLYEPLMAKRGNVLTEADRRGLRRLAEELGFDWYDRYGIEIN